MPNDLLFFFLIILKIKIFTKKLLTDEDTYVCHKCFDNCDKCNDALTCRKCNSLSPFYLKATSNISKCYCSSDCTEQPSIHCY